MEGCVDRQRDDRRLHKLIEGHMNQWRAVWTNGEPHGPMEGCVDRRRDDTGLSGLTEGHVDQWKATCSKVEPGEFQEVSMWL